jgi:hypothetical protein
MTDGWADEAARFAAQGDPVFGPSLVAPQDPSEADRVDRYDVELPPEPPWGRADADVMEDIRDFKAAAERQSLRTSETILPPWAERLYRWFMIPGPRRGGTYLYCPFFLRLHENPPMYCARFRSEAAYRRHYRRRHIS